MYEPRPVLLHDHLRVFGGALRQRQVAARAGPHREHRPLRRASARDDVQSVGEDRRRRRDLRAAAKLPQLAAGLRIVAAHEIRRVGDQLRPGGRRHDRRRAPRRQLLAIRLPDRFAGLGIEREQERIGLRVALHDHHAVPDDRRAGRSPFVGGNVVRAHVDAAEIDRPAQSAVDVVGVNALRAEPCDDDAAVGGGRGAGVGGLDVALVARLALRRGALPADLAACACRSRRASSAAAIDRRTRRRRRRARA